MKTMRVTPNPRVETERQRHEVSRVAQSTYPASDRARAANREWYPGLCTTCVNEPTCTFPRSANRPVMNCDEFEGVVATPKSVSTVRRDDRERWEIANREWYPGLCSICEKRETCTYPRLEGGVFHCEEYE